MPLSRRAFLRTALFTATGLMAACRFSTPLSAPMPTATPEPTRRPVPDNGGPYSEIQVLIDNLDFPEGPAFDPQGGLWCTEMGKGNLVHWDNGSVERIPTGGRPNSLAFDRQGRAWVPDSQQNAIRRYDPATGKWETLLEQVDGQPLHAPNDLAFDAQGNLVFTCPNYDNEQATGYIVCLRQDGTAKKIAEGWNRPNGLDFVDGGKSLVVGDTLRKQLFKGKWDAESAAWIDPQPWVTVGGKEGPDGMAPGADGRLYVAIYGDGALRVVDVRRGDFAHDIRLPDKNPTNVAVDPSGRLGLVVTGSEDGQLLSVPWIQPGEAIFKG